jgi:hypothetical protein
MGNSPQWIGLSGFAGFVVTLINAPMARALLDTKGLLIDTKVLAVHLGLTAGEAVQKLVRRQ